jgi:hypothetical protein
MRIAPYIETRYEEERTHSDAPVVDGSLQVSEY